MLNKSFRQKCSNNFFRHRGNNQGQNQWIDIDSQCKAGAKGQCHTFISTTADQDIGQHLWRMWLSEPQCNQYATVGTIPGHKEVKGDSVHKHHRLQNCPDHCVNLTIHTRWTIQSQQPTVYNEETPLHPLPWQLTMGDILAKSDYAGHSHSSVYLSGGHFNRVQSALQWSDNPLYLNPILGRTMATWRIDDWSLPIRGTMHFGLTTVCRHVDDNAKNNGT
eukprot:5812020-Amphidinium_carterae.1